MSFHLNDKKKVFILLSMFLPIFFLLTVSQLSAAYFDFLPAEIELPDGTVIECYASGDEFFNWLHDKDGFTIIVGEDGYYYYGVREGEYVIPSEYRVNTVEPAQVNLEPWAKISERLYQERRAEFFAPIERSGVRAPHTGTMNNLVVYIRFADDTEFTIPRSTYDQRFNDTDGISMRHYFQEVSYDQLDIISHHYPICDLTTNLSYQDSNPRSYFEPYHAVNNPNGYSGSTQRRIREHQLLANAIAYIEDEVPLDLIIDADNDGFVDNVSFIIRGNSGNWADLLWAHRWVLYSYDVYIHGYQVWDYTFQPENQSNASTLSHEMFHTLGAPDLYRYSYNGVPVGSWDLMASGFAHMGAWMKYKYAQQNWISEIPLIETSGTYTLEPLTSQNNNAFKIESPNSNFEFFVLEYRKQEGFYESNLPGTGLLIYRIDSRHDGNAQGPPDEVYIYRHNGTPTSDGSINLAHYNELIGRTEINDYTTNPVSFLGNGGIGGLHIHSVGEAGDTITFSVIMVGDLVAPILLQPENQATDIGVNPTFSWTNVNVADYYQFELATDNQFIHLVEEHQTLPATNYSLMDPLDVEETYYWRVRSVGDNETSDWSDTFTFTTAHFSPLDIDIAGLIHGTAIWADYNNNGYRDLLATGSNMTKLYNNSGNGNLIDSGLEFPSLRNSAAAWGDLTNNGYLDFVLTGRNSVNDPVSYIFANNGDNSFTEVDAGLTGVFSGFVALGDYNNNGWLDILITGNSLDDFVTVIYENNGDQTFSPVQDLGIPGLALGEAVWADLNNNGLLDLVLTGVTDQGGHADIYYNNGYGYFVAANAGFVGLSGASVDVGDFENNGFLDILLTGNSDQGPVTKIYRNNGDGFFTESQIDLPGVALGKATWGDFDQSGYLDILLSGFNTSHVYRNVEGHFVEVNAGLMPLNTSHAEWIDFNNDGHLDILLTGSGTQGTVLKLYKNNAGIDDFVPNTLPSTPLNPQAIVGQCAVNLHWEPVTDNESSSNTITYNLSIGTQSGLEDIMSSMSDLTTGFRKIPAPGNTGTNNEYVVNGLPAGTYYWRIQAVDGAFAGSPFSDEHTFTTTSVSAEEVTVAPFETKLYGNYPNPFNPETTIRFSLRENERVKLEIYNIAGQRVAILVDGVMEAGEHSVVWDARTNRMRDVSSGIYFYRLRTEDRQETRKMLYLK